MPPFGLVSACDNLLSVRLQIIVALLAGRSLFISKGWILSKRAQQVYFCCAVLSIAEFGLLVAAKAALASAGTTELWGAGRTLVQALIVPTVAGTATLVVAMWYFWFGFDKSYWLKKACWFFGMFFFGPLPPRNSCRCSAQSVPCCTISSSTGVLLC